MALVFDLLSFFALSLFFVFLVKKINFKIGMRGIDINKQNKPEIAESGGIALILSMSFFVLANPNFLTLFIIPLVYGIIGFLDDTKNKFKTKPYSWKTRAFIIALVSLLIGFFLTNNPFLAIVFALYLSGIASLTNTFAGLNGWEIGSSFIISVFILLNLPLIPLATYGLFFSIALLALLLANIYPAKIFPGDSGTLFIGSTLAVLALLTYNLKIILLVFLFYLPHLFDFFILKLLTNKEDISQKKMLPYLYKNKKLHIPKYKGRIRYDFAKFLIKITGPKREKDLVFIIWLIVFANCFFWTVLFSFF